MVFHRSLTDAPDELHDCLHDEEEIPWHARHPESEPGLSEEVQALVDKVLGAMGTALRSPSSTRRRPTGSTATWRRATRSTSGTRRRPAEHADQHRAERPCHLRPHLHRGADQEGLERVPRGPQIKLAARPVEPRGAPGPPIAIHALRYMLPLARRQILPVSNLLCARFASYPLASRKFSCPCSCHVPVLSTSSTGTYLSS
jgi:hypothetical protein